MDRVGFDVEVDGLVAITAAVAGAVGFCPGIGGSGTGVTLAGRGTGVDAFDEGVLDMGTEESPGTGTGVSLGVMMSVSSIDETSFAGLGWLQCTQQQSL